jgi:hypothetical protein
MKNVSELSGQELDYWVSVLQKWVPRYPWYLVTHGLKYWQEQELGNGYPFPRYSSHNHYNTAWGIIEREKISTIYTGENNHGWIAMAWDPNCKSVNFSSGDTMLIAVMREYVSKYYGTEVEQIKL